MPKWSIEYVPEPLSIKGQWKGFSFAIDRLEHRADAAIDISTELTRDEPEPALSVLLRNTGDKTAACAELSLRYTVMCDEQPVNHRMFLWNGAWTTDKAENHFIATGFAQTGIPLVLYPEFRTHIDQAAEEAAALGSRRFRVSLCADGAYDADGRLSSSPSLPLKVAPGETRRLTLRLAVPDSLDALRTTLRRSGMLAEEIHSGVNGTIAPRTDFFSDADAMVCTQVMASDEFCVKLCHGVMTSLSRTDGSLEMIDRTLGFGDMRIRFLDGAELGTRKMMHRELSIGVFRAEEKGLRLTRRCALQGKLLHYRWQLTNTTKADMDITDLITPFCMNTRMEHGVSASQKVLEHVQVAQDNSFFFYTPCDGKPPMLLCLPLSGTSYEMFESDPDRSLQGYLHAKGREAQAAQSGCRWPQAVSGLTIAPGETVEYGLSFQFVDSYEAARLAMVEAGLCDVEAVPGLTVPRGGRVILRVRCKHEVTFQPQHVQGTSVSLLHRDGVTALYEARFDALGENALNFTFDGRKGLIEFFVTLPPEQLITLRGRFIADHQIRDGSKWYNGLLAEQNNETGNLVTPDDHDLITGWRIYEYSCDDPGLSKPAFLAAKNAEYPVEQEVEALEYYVKHFVWGGLQRTEQEEYPYAIYGIPDWHELRQTRNYTSTELSHLWRAYDYPHIALMYLKLYEIGRQYPNMLSYESKDVYLERAYRTVMAMYTYPPEIGHTFVGPDGIYGTGFYNELATMDIIEALTAEGRQDAAARLSSHWDKKVTYFITQCQDLFCSEYPFDTTGFESTQAAVSWARAKQSVILTDSGPARHDYTADQVERFAKSSISCNVACRGNLENKYYLRGSDIRGSCARYLLSYMSQMGGWSLMNEALYGSGEPFMLLRLAYASALSSWALMNAGDEQSGYGYWFKGEAQNGAAGGGFEPTPTGYTWLEQPHHRGSWYYSCEIDLGFCGGLRAANAILAEDPDFGEICYGGTLTAANGARVIDVQDGVQRRFHWITSAERLHVLADGARLKQVKIERDKISLTLEITGQDPSLRVFTHTGQTVRPCGAAVNLDGRYRITDSSLSFYLPKQGFTA